ncbi:bifunctional diguanylate cyclase/phosphodiesterase [Noviherbaspirillum aridicola]|nr:EAL domain-containing protein [Noviherbaspirillum aridicola]
MPRNEAPQLPWLAIAFILIAVLWIATEARLSNERAAAMERGAMRAAALSDAYSEQISRTLDEIDRTTLLLRTLWQEKQGELNLAAYYRNGIFPSNFFNASVATRDGNVTASTFGLPNPLNFADRDWFRAHRADRKLGLLISPQEVGPRSGRPIIRFSRRLETLTGEFDGATWVTVEPPYLTTFYGAGQLNPGEFISIRLWNGSVLATRVGQQDGKRPIFYRANPVFSTTEGVLNEPGNKFVDGAERLVAWQKSARYPVVAIVGLKTDEILGAYRASAADWRLAASLVTVLLAAVAVVGMWFSRKLGERKRQAEDTKETYRLAVDAAQEGFYMLRPIMDGTGYALDFRIEDCNERAAAFAGMQRTDMLGLVLSKALPVEYQRDTLRILRNVMETGFLEEEFRVPALKGRQPAWLYRRFMRSAGGIAMVVRDISSSKAHEQELVQLANTDALTGLPNRHWLVNYLPLALARAGNAMKQLAVLFIDLDDFKNINDTLGHDAGDELLNEVALRLRQTIRASDHAVRLGGDEFTVVLEHLEGASDVSRVADQIIKSLGAPFTVKGISGQRIHASIGISTYPHNGRDGETLLKHADVAMYAAKSAGKGRYHFYHPNLSESLITRLSREHAVRHAVENDEFVVYFQPRYGVQSGRMSSMEALVRWQHPERGLLYPGEFIDVAEDTGLIVRLGELVIEKVCAQLAAWKRMGLHVSPVSVNVSPHQLKVGNVSSYLAACLRRHDVEARLVEVELTESAVIDQSRGVIRELQELRELGVKLMVDDFGTGHSSLAQLHRLDVDVLKVDKAFTDALTSGTEGQVLFQAIVSMASALDMCVVAEGVETPEQLSMLRKLNCDEVQGFLFSPAVPGDAVAALMARPAL